eukprot:GHVU01186893.1.p1 GENE.GHVU01186893.1~~GHVU01186893.1.p1  ORF type:complete len:218 (-),score=15.74 GHVU01186893.1:291-944(-)
MSRRRRRITHSKSSSNSSSGGESVWVTSHTKTAPSQHIGGVIRSTAVSESTTCCFPPYPRLTDTNAPLLPLPYLPASQQLDEGIGLGEALEAWRRRGVGRFEAPTFEPNKQPASQSVSQSVPNHPVRQASRQTAAPHVGSWYFRPRIIAYIRHATVPSKIAVSGMIKEQEQTFRSPDGRTVEGGRCPPVATKGPTEYRSPKTHHIFCSAFLAFNNLS